MVWVWQRDFAKHCPGLEVSSPRKDCHPVCGLQHGELLLLIADIE